MPAEVSSTLLNVFLILLFVWFIVLVISLITLLNETDILFPIKIFWAAIIFFAPVVGLIFYLLSGAKKNKRLK